MNHSHVVVLAVSLTGVAIPPQALAVDPTRPAEAAKGKEYVAAHCVQCHSGEWEDETYESTLAIIQAINSGKKKHRFKIPKLTDQQVKEVAAYWTPTPKSKKPAQTSSPTA